MRDILQKKKNNGFDIHLLGYNSTDLLPWLAFAHFDLQSFEYLISLVAFRSFKHVWRSMLSVAFGLLKLIEHYC